VEVPSFFYVKVLHINLMHETWKKKNDLKKFINSCCVLLYEENLISAQNTICK
jgi:hypothetical protein